MLSIVRDNIHIPFAKIGFTCVFLAYLAFLVYNITTPAYFINDFFTNPSFFTALKFLPQYLIFSALMILTVAAALYAYIEIGRYKQQIAFLTEERKLLEVRLPDDSTETLAAMEAVMEMISYTAGESLWFPVWWNGRKRPLHSFEIISKGGIVSFMIHTRAFFLDAIKSAVYTFYPKAQVTEVDDYVYDFEYDEEKYSIFSFEWKFRSDNAALPIKTYLEFQLEKQPDPGAVSPGSTILPSRPLVDPIAPLYDLFGSIGGDEQIWVQYVFRSQKYAKAKDESADDPTDPEYWKKQKLPEEIQGALIDLEKKVREGSERGEEVVLNAAERRLRETAARLTEKQALEVGIRLLYIAPEESFNPGRITPLTTLYKLTNTSENALIPHGTLLTDVYQMPDLEPERTDKEAEKRLLLQLYRDRMFWFAPALYLHQASDEKWGMTRWAKSEGPTLKRETNVMTTETLATICHFPTIYVKTPTVRRVLSTVVEPPENLPV